MIRLHGYDMLANVAVRTSTHVYKVRPKLHEDVPQYMDDEEPCYALKCIDLSEHDLPAEGKQRAVRETQTLLKLQHTNIARYHKAFLYEGRLCYMTDFAEAGTLHHLIYMLKECKQTMAEELQWHLFVQICHGLKKLHDCSIIHRALKTRNLLLMPETLFAHAQFKYRCKLTDVGIPELQRNLRLSMLSGSTLRYLAPEVLAKQSHDEKVDVWALGCILYEMMTLSHAFNSTSAIQRAEYAPVPHDAPAELAALLPMLLHPDPSQRPSVAEVLALPVVRERCAQMPNPAMLETEIPRPVRHVHPVAADQNDSEQSDDMSRGPSSLEVGTRCWAKHAADGLWHRGVVESIIDADSYMIQFHEHHGTDMVFFDGVQPMSPLPHGNERKTHSLSNGVILGFGKDDMQHVSTASSVRDVLDRKRSVRWSESLSSHGDSEKEMPQRASSSGEHAARHGHGSTLDTNSKHSSFSSRRVGGSQTDTELNTTTHTRTSYGGRSISDASESNVSIAAVRAMTANGRSGTPSFRVMKDSPGQAARPSVASTATAPQRSERSPSTAGQPMPAEPAVAKGAPPPLPAKKSSACAIL